MKITITLDTDNDAFADGNAGNEAARILRKAAQKIEDWPGHNEFECGLMDINGNKVGKLEAVP